MHTAGTAITVTTVSGAERAVLPLSPGLPCLPCVRTGVPKKKKEQESRLRRLQSGPQKSRKLEEQWGAGHGGPGRRNVGWPSTTGSREGRGVSVV